MCIEGMRVHPDGGLIVKLQKVGQATAVVVVPVGKNGKIHGGEVDAHGLRILREDRREQKFSRESLLSLAPERSEDSWQVPRLVK